MEHYPCAVCKKSVLNQHKFICSDHWNQWVQVKCNDLNDLITTFQNLRTSEMVPFCTVNSAMSLYKGNLNKPTGALIHLMN